MLMQAQPPGNKSRVGPFHGSADALALADIPERLLVVGGGIVGLELAGVYDALGSSVTVVELSDQLMPGCDPDLGQGGGRGSQRVRGHCVRCHARTVPQIHDCGWPKRTGTRTSRRSCVRRAHGQRSKASYTVIPQRFKNWTLPRLLPKRMVDKLIAKQLGLARTRAEEADTQLG